MNDSDNSKSLITQIFEETLDNLKNHPEFNQEIIDELTRLAKSGELKKHQAVSNSLKLTMDKDENTRG